MGLVHPDWGHKLGTPIYAGDYEDGLRAVDPDGTILVPDGSGRGVEYDLGFIEDHEVDRRTFGEPVRYTISGILPRHRDRLPVLGFDRPVQ